MPKFSTREFQGPLQHPKDINRLMSSLYPVGRVIHQDDFEKTTIQFEMYVTDAGGSGAIDSTERRVFRGDKAIKLTTGLVSGNRMDMRRRYGWPQSKKISMEFWFSSPDLNGSYLECGCYTFSGSQTQVLAMRHKFGDHKWQYYDSTPTFADLPGGAQNLESHELDLHHYVSLGMDLANTKYLHLKSDELFLDLTDVDAWIGTSTTVPYIRIYMRVATGAAAATEMWFDDYILSEL